MLLWLAAGFAAFRLGQMLALEDGPFDLFAIWRERVGTDRQETWLQRGFACPGCISFWAAALCAGLTRPADWIEFVLAWLAAAGVAQLLNLCVRRL